MRWIAMALACLTLLACGGDDDGPAQPTATATSPAGSVGITFLLVMDAAPGERAGVTIRTDPVGVECAISYTDPSGAVVDAPGLEPATTRGSGTVSWEWTVSGDTQPGIGHITVTCDDSSATSEITIG